MTEIVHLCSSLTKVQSDAACVPEFTILVVVEIISGLERSTQRTDGEPIEAMSRGPASSGISFPRDPQ